MATHSGFLAKISSPLSTDQETKKTNNNNIPSQYYWPKKDLIPSQQQLQESVVDLKGFFLGDKDETLYAAKLVRESCLHHGIFQVINHGVDSDLIRKVHHHAKAFFVLPLSEKLKREPLPGSRFGYSFAHSSRFVTKLPWKELITFPFPYIGNDSVVVDFFESKFGEEFQETGVVFQKYCEALKKLSLVLMEIIGISLELDGNYFKKFYEDGGAIVRANCYPICPEPGLTLGVGPHHDPTSLTILHQDDVGGLEVLVDDKWKSVRPRNDAFVINIGDTFSAITNGMYKSCMHRVIVNKHQDRISLTYFLNPKEDKVIKPPEDLIMSSREDDEPRKYPNFTWSDFLDYTFKHYRADGATFENFTNWLLSSKTSSYYSLPLSN